MVEQQVGRLAWADIWLMYDGRHWRVRGRLGGDGGREVNYQFDQEWSARAMVDRMSLKVHTAILDAVVIAGGVAMLANAFAL